MRAYLAAVFCIFVHWAVSQSHFSKAYTYYQNNSLDSARLYTNYGLRQKPTVELYLLSGMIHEAQGQPLNALADYEAVISTDKSNAEAHFNKAIILYETGYYEHAATAFTATLELMHTSATKGVYYIDDPLGEKGTRLGTIQSMEGEVLRYRAMAYQRQGKHEEALSDYEKAAALSPSVDLLVSRAEFNAELGRTPQAIADLKRAIVLDSASYLAWYNLILLDHTIPIPHALLESDYAPFLSLRGYQALEDKEYTRALDVLDRSLALREDATTYLNRGRAKIKLKDYEGARHDFVKVLELDEWEVDAYYLIGNTLFYETRYAEAISFYESYLEKDRGNGAVWFNNAMANLSLSQKDRGCSCLLQAQKHGMKQAPELYAKHCKE